MSNFVTMEGEMMYHDLNSILVEGWVRDLVTYKDGVFTATLMSSYVYRDGDKVRQEYHPVNIEVHGKLAETCDAYIKKQKLRVVGRLKTATPGGEPLASPVVECEYVETMNRRTGERPTF
jgi:hypothetical protein